MKKIILLGLLASFGCLTTALAQTIPPTLHARIVQLEDERNLNGDELAKLLKHASPKVRERAALAIGRIGDKHGTAALIELLQTEKDEQVRAMAAFALGEMEDAAAVPALLTFLEPGKFALETRARPAEALCKIASVPANIESLGKQTFEQISDRLSEQLPDPKAMLTADQKLLAGLTITALTRVRPVSAVEPLTQQLKSTDADIRAQAGNALSRIRQPIASAVPALMEALNDRDHNVRANAARALGVSKDAKCEVNTRPYERGTLGMALSGKDTGGSQFFITHSPQPHLDGGYTVFGQVTKGMEVVDRIARGDTIKRITIVEG